MNTIRKYWFKYWQYMIDESYLQFQKHAIIATKCPHGSMCYQSNLVSIEIYLFARKLFIQLRDVRFFSVRKK